MSDSYVAIVDEFATKENAPSLAEQVLNVLIDEEIVNDRLDPEATLGGEGGYRPGTRIPQLWTGEASAGFWDLLTNGLEVIAKPWFNVWGGECFHYVDCPKCSARFDSTDSIPKGIFEAAGRFMNGEPIADVTCPQCGEATIASAWKAKHHFGFCYLAFLFWNWPPLDDEDWEIDLPALIQGALGHPIITTYGHM